MNRRSKSIGLAGFVLLFGIVACGQLSAAPVATEAETETAIPTALATAVVTASFAPTEALLPTNLLPSTPALSGPAIQRLVTRLPIDITFIHMITVTDGWAIGGPNGASDHVLRTQDGGQTWSDVTPPQPLPAADDTFKALGFFKDASTAWVVYSPAGMDMPNPPFIYVWRTSDGGATWQYGAISTSDSNGSFLPSHLTFVDSQHGWLMVILGGGMMHEYVAIYSTTDGGAVWNNILDPFSDNDIQSFPKTGFVFADAQNGWLTRDGQGVDSNPHVFRTTDGGMTWNRIDLPAPSNKPTLFDDHACGTYAPNLPTLTSIIVAMKCVDSATYQKQLDFQYATTDGGATWQILPLPPDYLIGAQDSLDYLDDHNGFALGRNIYETTDGGETWEFVKQVDWDGQFSFVNMETGWAVARADSEIAFVHTATAGIKWSIITPLIAP